MESTTDNLISELNTEKIFKWVCVATFAFTIYGFIYDFFMGKMPLTFFNVSIKSIFILVPFVFYVRRNFLSRYNRILIFTFIYVFYCPYYIYNVSIAYIFASLQLYFVMSNILFLKKREYLVLSALIFISTLIAAVLTQSPYPTSPQLNTLKPEFIENFISLYVFCFISYFYSHSKRLEYLTNELKFSNIGKTSSFLIHEMAKPMINQSETNEKTN